MAPTETLRAVQTGCAFLTRETVSGAIFTPEDLSPEHLALARTADEFFAREVEPGPAAIRHQDYAAARSVLCKAAEPGLTAIQFPERSGGMELDLPSVLRVA